MTDAQRANSEHRCPRCLGYIPNNHAPGAYPGALSRKDNKSEICSECGLEEAFLDWDPKTRNTWRQTEVWPIDSPRRQDGKEEKAS